jgi:LCP family protein required for cell wall assembly
LSIMSDWPDGWYRNEPGQQGADHGPGEARQVPTFTPKSNWPEQPPARSLPERDEPDAAPGADPAGLGGPGLGAPGLGAPDVGTSGGRRWRFWGQPGRRGRRITLVIGVVVALVIVSTVGSYFWVDSKLHRTVTLPAFSGQSDGTNWLIAGSDGRDGLTTKEIIQLHVGFDFGTANSDSLMLLHMGGGSGPVLVSIPRDSYVPIPGFGDNKINAALGFGGPALLIKTVENVTGLRINHFAEIGFAGLANVVNQVGGVNICLKTALHDQDSGANLNAGCQTLNGAQALAFVRDRHSFADEDLQREQDQRAFLKALLDKATSPGVFLNPFVALPFASGSANAITVDQGTHLWDLIQLALALRNPQTGTVPVANPNYLTSNAGDALLWNQAQALELFNALKNDQSVPKGLLTGTTVG